MFEMNYLASLVKLNEKIPGLCGEMKTQMVQAE